jgi:hypothetical protein
MANDYLAWINSREEARKQHAQQELRKSCFHVAQAGHNLYKWLFQPERNPAWPGTSRNGWSGCETRASRPELVIEGGLSSPGTSSMTSHPTRRRS